MTDRLFLTSADVRVLHAVLAEHAAEGRATVKAVAHRAERAVATTHMRLRRLRSAGLVAWEDGKTGTLRPLVRAVPFGSRVLT